jgi:hypothetical protein
MAAARRMKDFAPAAHQRRRAGLKAADGIKGKASTLVGAEQVIGTRIVELAWIVLRDCTPEMVAAVDSKVLSVTTAAKLAKAHPHVQKQLY